MGHRIVVMKDGDVQQVGTPKQIYDTPANLFVAGFMGSPSMSFLECQLVAEGDALFAKAPSFSVRIPDERRAILAAARDRAVTLGVRPEDFTLNSSESGAIPAVVEVVEPLGSIHDFRNELLGRLDRGQTRETIRDAFKLFVQSLAMRAGLQMCEDVVAARLVAAAHVVPKRFNITTPHRLLHLSE